MTIKVLIVDDSAVVRQVVAGILAAAPGIEVLAAAADPLIACERMRSQWPDVIVLDVEMPRMDGLTFLKKIMAERPTPVVMCSSLTERGTRTSLDALAAGAVGVLAKPMLGVKAHLEAAAAELVRAVREAATVNPRRLQPAAMSSAASLAPVAASPAMAPAVAPPAGRIGDAIVAIGTSTGGTQALEAVLTALPATAPGLVIVQHMPEKFTAQFALRLDGLCRIDVREARGRERVLPGLALIAPGGRHLLLKRSGAQFYVEVQDGPHVNRHRPSVDVLFRSVAEAAGGNALGIIMTGMGDDGARGLLSMREAGATTLAQDEASCVVYGMPKEAVRLGAAERSVSLAAIAGEIMRHH
jgi:two-component system, chemotaxis family, protein-glutamate methylesterase/glutaminase